MIEDVAAKVNADTALVRRGRYVSLDFLVGIGDTDYIVAVREGRVMSVGKRRLPLESVSFAIRAGRDVWTEHWKPMPKRDRHDLFNMVSAGLATLDGDLLPFMQNLQYFKDVLASPRAAAGEA
ncbi:MAG: hypothetical protein GKS00_22285 [Alphaproteobacteria bacterium]|nr:hypothetical protein [Alphaproteobacteria bacterium]